MVKDIFEIETLGSKKFICHSESGNWVLANYLDETVAEKISSSHSDLFQGISLTLLNVGRTCNFDCVYCLIGDLKQEGNRMPNKVGMKAIDRITELDESDRYVIFHGSEPMINFELIKDLILYSEEKESRIRFALQSNGSLFNEENLSFLTSKGVYIGVSLDGTEEHQNKNRPYLDGLPSYNDVINNIHLIKEAQGGIGVITVVTRDNVGYLRDIAEHFENEGIDTVYFCPVSQGKKDIAPDERELISNMTEVLDRYFLAKLNGRKTIEIENVRRYLINLIPKVAPPNCVQCSTSSKYPLVGIDINGDIYPCDYFWENKRYLMGNIFENSLKSVINQPCDFRIYRSINDIPGCSSCNWRRFCGGGCPGTLVMKGKDVDRKGYYCGFTKTMLRYIVELLPLLHQKNLISEIICRKSAIPLEQV